MTPLWNFVDSITAAQYSRSVILFIIVEQENPFQFFIGNVENNGFCPNTVNHKGSLVKGGFPTFQQIQHNNTTSGHNMKT